MPRGAIKKLVPEKGFGFIESNPDDAFFHHSAVDGTTFDQLKEGEIVEFDLGHGPKGPRAEHVRVVEQADE